MSRFEQPATLSVEQAAKYLGIGRNLAYAAVRAGTIPHIRLNKNGKILVPIVALERLLEAGGTEPNGDEGSATTAPAPIVGLLKARPGPNRADKESSRRRSART